MTGRRLTVAAVVLAGATICPPLRIAFWLNGSIDRNLTDLRDDVDRGVVALWAEGAGTIGPSLAQAARVWAAFHAVKAAWALALLAALMECAAVLIRRAPHMAPLRWWGLWTVNAVAAALTVLVVVANLQGLVAPLSSVWGLHSTPGGDPALAEALAGLRLAVSADRGSPAVDVLIADHVRYHRAMAWLGGGASGLLVAASGWVWRSRQGVGNTGPAPAARRVRTALGLTCAGLAAFAIFFGVVTAANVSTVLNPRPTLASAF